MSNTVKHFHSGMTGAPSLSGAAGSLIALLDACLINGWGAGTLDSLTISGGIATATRSGGHSQIQHGVAQLSGITGTYSALNGDHKVLSVTATTFTFDATGHADGTAAGTISQKVAPASAYWTKAFSGTNLAAYRSTDPVGTQRYLRVDDSGTTEARVLGYESMTDANTGSGAFPNIAQPGQYLAKANNTTGTRPWYFAADSRCFYLAIAHTSGSADAYLTSFFGDLNPTMSSDPYACMLTAGSSSYAASTPGGGSSVVGHCVGITNSEAGTHSNYCSRSYSALGNAVLMRKGANSVGGLNSTSNLPSGSTSWNIPYPNPTNGALYIAPLVVVEDVSEAYRGDMPGAYHFPQSLGSANLLTNDSFSSVIGATGKTFKVVRLATNGNAWCLDVTGPWR